MRRKKRASSPLDLYDDDFDDDASSHSSQPPVQRNAANARERMRMRVLSSAYGRLKTKLPNIPPDTKLSKLDTLRLATLYIKQLINAVETSSASGTSTTNTHPNLNSPADMTDALDTRHSGTDYGTAVGGIASPFNFHNSGHPGMSWPFEFHQHMQHGHSRNSNSSHTFSSARMDWQSSQAQSYPKTPRHEPHMATEVNYTQLQDAHWYPNDMGLQLEQTRNANGCCAYESAGVGQHQRGIAISSSQTHRL
ncbi:T-cell acute lymphocytic leukemia protein 1 homolog [Drosophila grimshawi]|uniref:GH22024 n=1 Tax=Drosophila grimshawi TaxID=7222 RepID=B4J9J1_DROGR|nr:T-cell acute lymphocytic leukemia protein 1 homolog [Drosophila grimshawi]EDW02498.1 GH22024 [Drosophila grimshawi]